MTLDHLGIAVADAEAAVAVFERLLSATPYKAEAVEREGVRTVFFGDGGRAGAAPKLELLEALRPDSPVATFLEKRGPGLHHIAFEVDDVEAAMARLDGLGFRLLADAPRPGADGMRIVFLHPKSTAGVLVELCERAAPAPERLDVPWEGGPLAAWVSGPAEGPPLVVLHGALGRAGAETAPLVRRWQHRFRVHALDFVAQGASEGVPLSADRLVACVVALLGAAGLSRTTLFGHALGGAVALHVAARHPERVTRLAVHAAPPDGTGTGEPDDSSRAAPSDDALAALPHPTLVTCGDADEPFLLRHAVHLRTTLPHATLAVLPGVGRALRPADAPLLADLVAGHLGGVE
jgi:methylmalonyl-CoA epimerase